MTSAELVVLCLLQLIMVPIVSGLEQSNIEATVEISCPKTDQWMCRNGRCVPATWRCDAVDQCGDNSDEDNCHDFVCPYGEQSWKCYNGACIMIYQVCNGIPDCVDKSDETRCEEVTCMDIDRPFKCDNGICLSTYRICDGTDDCGDNSDEASCKSFECPEARAFKCNNSVCVSKWYLCDLVDNCGDNSDETNCQKLECPFLTMKCANGKCYSYTWRCDGHDDCGDNSDESDCEKYVCPSDRTFRCDNGACVAATYVCDGEADCSDNTDETWCMHRECAARKEFKCQNSLCVYPESVCDGKDNCGDNSDENNCEICPEDRAFKCESNACITTTLMCNTFDDCGDGTDEASCPVHHRNLGKFRCGHGHWIDAHHTCNGVDDCGDNTDEEGCDDDNDWKGWTGWTNFKGKCPQSVNGLTSTVAVDWRGDGNYTYCSWYVFSNWSMGVVVRVVDVSLQLGDSRHTDDVLLVHSGQHVWTYREDSVDDPVIIKDINIVSFELVTYRHADRDTLGTVSMSLSYAAYPRHLLPPMLHPGVYNCSFPYSVPLELQCDGFAQCLQAEDELDYNCSYSHVGCHNGWVAGGSFCLKFVFPESSISPDGARQECRDKYQAELGSLPHPSVRRLATHFLVRKGFDKLIVGLERVQVSRPGLSYLYRFLWQWPQAGTEFDGPLPNALTHTAKCSTLTSLGEFRPVPCNINITSGFVCSRPNIQQKQHADRKKHLRLDWPTITGFRLEIRQCDGGHLVHLFHPCSADTATDTSAAQLPLMLCKNGQRVHYTGVCDGYDDCGDQSDETDCQYVGPGPLAASRFFECKRKTELVVKERQCDGVPDCHDSTDETNCVVCSENRILCGGVGCMPCDTSVCSLPLHNATVSQARRTEPNYGQTDIDGYGIVGVKHVGVENDCPETHFLCRWATTHYCIPSFLVGNGQWDCPMGGNLNSSADEPSGELICPGHYRCYRHTVCVHPTYFCDGVYHCPLKDDERYCNLPCPEHCTCEGLAYSCSHMFDPASYLQVRYLNLSGTHRPFLGNIYSMGYLSFLNLSRCGLTEIIQGHLHHVRVLDYSFNKLETVKVGMDTFPLLRVLNISVCKLIKVTLRNLNHLLELDLSGNHLTELSLDTNNVRALEVLDLSSNNISKVTLEGLKHLRWLDLSDNGLLSVDLDNRTLPALEFLRLSSCRLNKVNLGYFGHLHRLDLSSNNLTSLSHVALIGLHTLLHLNLSRNPLLPRLDATFQTFLHTSGIVGLQSLFLSSTGIQSIEADPFVGINSNDDHLDITSPEIKGRHLDITGNDLSSVDRNMFSAWTSQLSLLETSSVSVCCAYYYSIPNSTVNCQTPTEVIFPEQCIRTALGEKLQYHTAFGLPDQQRPCDVGWLSFQSLCLRFVFPVHSVSAQTARRECQDRFGSHLAALPVITDIARSLMPLFGHRELVVGLEKVRGHGPLYRFLWQWTQGSVEFDVPRVYADSSGDDCVAFCADCLARMRVIKCSEDKRYAYVCSRTPGHQASYSGRQPLTLTRPSMAAAGVPLKVCTDGSLVQPFHPCWPQVSGAGSSLGHSVLIFCRSGRRVHYTMVCDGHDDCGDNEDEKNCGDVRSDPLKESFFLCTVRKELVHVQYQCNGIPDCHDGSDEDSCGSCSDGTVQCLSYGCLPEEYANSKWLSCGSDVVYSNTSASSGSSMTNFSLTATSDLTVANLDLYGFPYMNTSLECPETHLRCSGNFCVPSFLVNNGVPDCPLSPANDETFSSLSCPGYYHCYQSGVCIHPHFLCDGTYHCPLKDDERYCNLPCPVNCTCEGLAFCCSVTFDPAVNLHVRYLDLSGSFKPTLDSLPYLAYLSYLNLSSCQLDQVSLVDLVHLRVLDLSHNQLTNLTYEMLGEMPLLTHLNVSHNPLALFHLGQLLVHLNSAKMGQLLSLGFAAIGIEFIEENTFQSISSLQHIDLRGNEVREVYKGIFQGLTDLQILETDDPRLCCPYSHVYPNKTMDCRTPVDQLSSCSELLRSDFFRVFLWTLSVTSIIGNVGVVIYRLVLEAQGTSPGFRILVTSLCVADLLMGLYIVIIGAADSHYSGQYIWQQEVWTDSALCQTAGFVALLSSEVSAFMICLVTLDRLLVLCLPFSHQLHMTPRSTTIACGVVWLVGVMLAAAPMLPAEWEFYGQTGICLPLPITRRPFPGQRYAFAVFVVLNFLLFVLIGAGQLVIFKAIRNTVMASTDSRRKQDLAIARRLFLIVFSDFSCWFPIGLMGLLANHGTPIPDEVNVWAAVFILPVNSALNPFLYTLGIVLEKWLKKREERRIQRTLAKLHADLASWPDDKLHELVRRTERVLMSRPAARNKLSSDQEGRSHSVGSAQDTRCTVQQATLRS